MDARNEQNNTAETVDETGETIDEEVWRGDRDTAATLVDGIAGVPTRGDVVPVDEGERPPIIPGWLRAKQSRRMVLGRAVSRRW